MRSVWYDVFAFTIGSKAEEYFKTLVRKSESEIKSAVKIMESCVSYLLMSKVIREENGNTAFLITNYINENMTGDLSVGALCREFQFSRNMLYHIADTYFGMPIAQYVRLKRVKKAQQLLKDGIPVTRVAELTGFFDYVYFGKVFKKYTGKTPTDVKKEYQLLHARYQLPDENEKPL